MRWARSSSISELLSILSSSSTERLVNQRECIIYRVTTFRRGAAAHRHAAANLDKTTLGKPWAESGGQVGIHANEGPLILREHESHQVLGLLAALCDDRPNDESATEGAQAGKRLDLASFPNDRELG